VLGATYGGTGQSSITTGDLLYGSASNTISKLAIGSTGTILRVVGGVPAWGTDYTGTVTSVAALTLGTTGTDLSSTVANGTTTPVITLNVPTASATNRGVLSSADWTTFNNKGSGSVTSVAATVPAFLSISGSPITTSGTLAITYSGTALPVANGGTGLVSLTAGYIPYGNGTSALSSSSGLTTNGSNLTATGSITGGSLVTTGGGTLNGSFSVGSTGYPQFVASAGSAAYLKIDATVNGGGQLWRIGDGIYNFGIFSIYNQTANLFPLNVFASGGVSIGNTTDPGAANLSVNGDYKVATTGKGFALNDFGGIKTFGWGNVSSISQDLSTLFSNITFTNRGISIQVQVITQSSSSAATSATFVGLRTPNSTWSFTIVNATTSATNIITPSGSGTTLTLSFSTGNQFGAALVTIITQS
jgi:hypothetical protein